MNKQLDMLEFLRDLLLSPDTDYTIEQIKAAWKKLCFEHHPDRGGDSESFNRVTHAYNMLVDPSYAYSHRNADSRSPKFSLDIYITVKLTFEQAFFGANIPVVYEQVRITKDLAIVNTKEHKLISVVIPVPPGAFNYLFTIPCGGIFCDNRIGNGFIQFPYEEHPLFKVDNFGNICSTHLVPLEIMLCGGQYEVPTMLGPKEIRILPASLPDVIMEFQDWTPFNKSHRLKLLPEMPSKEELMSGKYFSKLGIVL